LRGHALVANAGHLSPYCNGIEVDVPAGLPLGITEEGSYEQVQFDFDEGARLVFLSDGVVEARSKSGELFGFDRTRNVSVRPVQEIAREAQRFGQEDDITVIGIERKPVPAFA
jgi:phosphoserine phosphatase RsbU/P